MKAFKAAVGATALHTARTTTAAAVTAGLLIGGTQLVLGTVALAKGSALVATTAVNVRTGPGTANRVVGVLQPGERVTATGSSVNGWTPITYRGTHAWVATSYLTADRQAEQVTTTVPTGGGNARTTDALNVRTGPGTDNAVVTVLPKGTALKLTGRTSGSWLQVSLGGQQVWVNKAWVSTGAVASAPTTTKPTPLPAVKGRARATSALMIRTAAGPNFTSEGDIPSGTILNLTGVAQQGVSQVIWQGRVRWVNSSFLAAVGTTPTVPVPATPKVVAYRYATTALSIRSSATGSSVVSEVPAGTKLGITGATSNGRAQVVHSGTARWVTSMYLSSTAPASGARNVAGGGSLNTGDSSGLDTLQPAAKGIVYMVRQQFGQISTMYGVRADSLPDHPSGHAVDVMLPNYRSNEALGWTIANYMKSHASELNIKYIIFHQHIWSVARSGEGWRAMSDRGDDNANHFNHVHVTVN